MELMPTRLGHAPEAKHLIALKWSLTSHAMYDMGTFSAYAMTLLIN